LFIWLLSHSLQWFEPRCYWGTGVTGVIKGWSCIEWRPVAWKAAVETCYLHCSSLHPPINQSQVPEIKFRLPAQSLYSTRLTRPSMKIVKTISAGTTSCTHRDHRFSRLWRTVNFTRKCINSFQSLYWVARVVRLLLCSSLNPITSGVFPRKPCVLTGGFP